LRSAFFAVPFSPKKHERFEKFEPDERIIKHEKAKKFEACRSFGHAADAPTHQNGHSATAAARIDLRAVLRGPKPIARRERLSH